MSSGDLDCKTKTLELDGTGSSQGSGITFTWSVDFFIVNFFPRCSDRVWKDSKISEFFMYVTNTYLMELPNSNH